MIAVRHSKLALELASHRKHTHTFCPAEVIIRNDCVISAGILHSSMDTLGTEERVLNNNEVFAKVHKHYLKW